MLDSVNSGKLPSKIVRPKRPRGKSTAFGLKLRKLIGPVYGVIGTGGLSRMKNATWVTLRNKHGRRFEDRFQLPYSFVNSHEAGRPGLKVSARHGFQTLLYFDLDTHSHGSADDVIILCQIVRDLFPSMPPFVCNERGGSGWAVLDTSGTSAIDYNALVTRVEDFFRSVSEAMKLRVEFVEVKGRVYAPTFDDSGRCLSVHAGDLLKCPPTLEYLEQPSVDASYLASSVFDPWGVVTAEVTQDHPVTDQKDNPFAGDNSLCGSFKPKLVSEEVASRLADLTEFVVSRFSDRPTRVGTRKISARQFAEVLFSLVILPPNIDGTNPYLRHQGFTSAMFDTGIFNSKFRFELYKAVRDYISKSGGITWTDNVHRPGRFGEPGQACKWSLDLDLLRDVRLVLGLESFDNTQHYTLVTNRNNGANQYGSEHRIPTMLQLAQVLTAQEIWTQKRLEEIFSQVAA